MNWRPEFGESQLRKVLSLSEQFLLDASVLIFVFPILDTVVQFGRNAITTGLVLWTLAISGVFFIWAMVLGIVAAGE